MSDEGGPPESAAPSGSARIDPPTSASSDSSPPSSDISAVGLKLLPLWLADPEVWFAQVEAQFACRRLTSHCSKFDHVVSSLSPEYVAEVRDPILRPPVDNPYTALKEQITKRTVLSEQQRL